MRARKWTKVPDSRLGSIMSCFGSSQLLNADDRVPSSSESLATRDYSASMLSSRTGEGEHKQEHGNIEEAESSLRESVTLNYEEARALLGRLEYQKGNIEAALHVFDGIDIAAMTPRIKSSIMKRAEGQTRHSSCDAAPFMSLHAISLLFEAIFLKSRSLQKLERLKEAAQSCKIILDTIESALPEGLSENFSSDCKLQEVVTKAVELLPELWKFAGFFREAILSYRQALLYNWNLDAQTNANIQKEFAIFLLYSGIEAGSPALRWQMEVSFVPKSNLEEAILLLLILFRNFFLKRIEWDPSIIDHITFALAVSGEFETLAKQVEALPSGILERREFYYTLALCYFGEGDDEAALNLLTKLFSRGSPKCVSALLLASKICSENSIYAESAMCYAQRALANLSNGCLQIKCIGYCLLGISLSSKARSAVSDTVRSSNQCDALAAFEAAGKLMSGDPEVLFYLSLENAERRNLDTALGYAKQLIKVEAGSSVKGWILLARILSAQKYFFEAEMVINAGLDQVGKWDEGKLLKTKAKVQFAQGQLKNVIETYTHLLASLEVRGRSFGVEEMHLQVEDQYQTLEMEAWYDLAHVYISMSKWQDAEVCLTKASVIRPHAASGWHSKGVMYEAQGLYKEALSAFSNALEINPTHVPSLVSAAIVLRQLGNNPSIVARNYLVDALQFDRTNHTAWFNLGLIYAADSGCKSSATEAAECFKAALLLEESAPVEPFR